MHKSVTPLAAASLLMSLPNAQADEGADLAKQLANPVASLISVPIDIDLDSNLGPNETGKRTLLVTKPVVPIELNQEWNLISRTILPFISIKSLTPGMEDESGMGDIQASFFLSPKAPTDSGWIWGVGPIALLPSATEDALGNDKWGLGPTGVALKQQGALTYGLLANHVWSYAGDDARTDYTRSFVQPFFTYTTKTATSFTLQTESTYDWESEEWSVPVNLIAAQVLKLGDQLLQVRAGLRYWADAPNGAGPEEWGFKLGVTLLFPK
ncbi:MAG: transporter [Gammaproteobacteria bacterium (ex Lamellibrachia satsuma)]|nr:MAG: transporter [Gammaproteobacteria bacterium (ex Lamellibrachia satsuma)]